jgi:hypothetical protein
MRRLRMNDSEELARRRPQRRQIIERLNQEEDELLSRERSVQKRAQMSEEELEAAIERERNDWRNQFGPAGGGAGV